MKIKLLNMILEHHFDKNKTYYNSIGYTIKHNNNSFEITFHESIYHLQVISDNKKKYLKLTPYNESYFRTELNLKELKFKIDMILFTLKKNEELFKHAKHNINNS